MNDKDIFFKSLVIITAAVTLLFGLIIAANIITTSYTKDLVKLSLEKGQNPVYVKCAMETNSSNECKTMMTVIAISKSDK
jgi:ABC-type uncharacterized transport system fused permease/ATPase subunit